MKKVADSCTASTTWKGPSTPYLRANDRTRLRNVTNCGYPAERHTCSLVRFHSRLSTREPNCRNRVSINHRPNQLRHTLKWNEFIVEPASFTGFRDLHLLTRRRFLYFEFSFPFLSVCKESGKCLAYSVESVSLIAGRNRSAKGFGASCASTLCRSVRSLIG